MKKILKVMLISILSVICLLTVIACGGNQGGGKTPGETFVPDEDVIVDDLVDYDGEYDKPHNTAYGEAPDLDEVIIDGYFDEDIWQNKKWYTNYHVSNPNFKFSVTAHLSQGGLYIAAQSDDSYLFWNGRNYFFYNTYMQFLIAGSNLNLRVDVNNTPPTNMTVNVRSRYEGTLNQFGGGEGFFVEAYISWEQLGFDEVPETISMLPQYYWTMRPRTTNNLLALPFVNGTPNSNQYYTFDTDGYVDVDDPAAKVGSHERGLSKSNGWEVENPGTDDEILISNDEALNRGFIKSAFFRELYTNRFMLTTRVTVNSVNGMGRAGLLMYTDNINYRAFAIELGNDVLTNNTLTTLPIRAYTNYPANITVTTNIVDAVPDTEDGRQANQFDLTVFANNGMLYYLVNGEFVYSEDATYIGTVYTGFYAYNADVTFSNYEAKVFSTDAEIGEEISKYVYTVEIQNHNAQAVEGRLSQIATSNDGTGDIDVSLVVNIGRDLQDGKYLKSEITEIYYEVVGTDDPALQHVDLMDAFLAGSEGTFTIENVPGNIIVHIDGEQTQIDASQLVELKIGLHSPQINGPVTAVNFELYGSGPAERYEVLQNNVTGVLTVKVPKGNSWRFVASKTGYRNVADVINGGAVINESMTEAETFNMNSAIVGGTAVSADDARYNPDTGEYESVAGFTRASTPGVYWDLSEEANNKVTFTSTNTGSSIIYYSGKTAAEYQVAYVELTNQTDYMAFQSIEDDPGVGFCIDTNRGGTFCGLRQTGIRIMPAGMVGWNPTDINNLVSWSGGIASIDRNQNGKVLGVSMGQGTVNRVPYNGETYTTSYLMIRRGGNVFLYAANGRAGVQPDGTNFNKMQPFYQGYIPEATGVGAIGFQITVSYNLRVDFENYWILAGQEQAGSFANDIISTGFSVEGETDLVNIASDGLIDYDEETGTGKIMLASEVVFTAKQQLPEGKIVKLNLGSEVSYLTGTSSEAVLNVTSIDNPINVNVQLVDATEVTGNISIPTAGVSLGERSGYITDVNGNQVATFVTDEDGYFTCMVEEGVQYIVTANVEGYAAEKIEFTATGSQMNVGEIAFALIDIGSPVGGFKTNTGMEYGIDDMYHGVYAHWETSTQGDAYLTINAENNNLEDFVLTFNYVRSSAAQNGVTDVKDEADLGLGIVVTGADATGYQFLNIGTGYRIFNDAGWNGRFEERGMGRVDFQATSIPYSNYAQVKIIKTGSTFYLFSKYAQDDNYTLTVAFPAVNSAGQSVLSGAVTFAIKMTVTSGKYLNLTFFDIKVSEVNAETAPEIISNVTLQQPEEGSLTVEGQTGNQFQIIGASNLTVVATPPEEMKVSAIYVNGTAQDLGNYTEGVFRGQIAVSGDSTISVEFTYITYETTQSLTMLQMNNAASIKLSDGEREIVMTVSMLASDLSDSVAVINTSDRTITFMAPKGTWTLTVCSDRNGNTPIGKPVTVTVQ